MPRKPSDLCSRSSSAIASSGRLERDRAEPDEAVGMRPTDLGDLVVDRARGGEPEIRIGAVIGLARRRRDRLDVDPHQVHVGDALLGRVALHPRAHAVLRG